ncbi:MAG: DUF4405 domain-containing protein [Clostridiales bacterium]|nr:DUF4405 domain-containing protein [Clostridiales bacterium]MCF8021597.1 DUF4405 domain-containing protein [Clostridiales bacterium]
MGKNTNTIRGIVSTITIINALMLSITGFALYAAPRGKIAKTIDWTFLGIDRFSLATIHTYLGFIFTLVIIIHFIINLKMYTNEIKRFFK